LLCLPSDFVHIYLLGRGSGVAVEARMGWIEDRIRGICGYLYLCGGFVAGGELVGSVAGRAVDAIVGDSLVSCEYGSDCDYPSIENSRSAQTGWFAALPSAWLYVRFLALWIWKTVADASLTALPSIFSCWTLSHAKALGYP